MKKLTEMILRWHIWYQKVPLAYTLFYLNLILIGAVISLHILNINFLYFAATILLVGNHVLNRNSSLYKEKYYKLKSQFPIVDSLKEQAAVYTASLIPLSAFFAIVYLFSGLGFMSLIALAVLGGLIFLHHARCVYPPHSDKMVDFLMMDIKEVVPEVKINTEDKLLLTESKDLDKAKLTGFSSKNVLLATHFVLSGIDDEAQPFELMNIRKLVNTEKSPAERNTKDSLKKARTRLYRDLPDTVGVLVKVEHDYQVSEYKVITKADDMPKAIPAVEVERLMNKFDQVDFKDNLQLVITPEYLYWVIMPKHDEQMQLLSEGVFRLSEFDILDKLDERKNAILRVLKLLI
jgi:hypothetical protein